jgi:hypothetical protein
MYQPIASATCREFLKRMMGPEYDILPLTHPRGFPQTMFMDIQNTLGKGKTALFMSTPKKQYYLYMWPSLADWLESHVSMVKNRQFEINHNYQISTFLDIENIDKDYIKENLKAEEP